MELIVAGSVTRLSDGSVLRCPDGSIALIDWDNRPASSSFKCVHNFNIIRFNTVYHNDCVFSRVMLFLNRYRSLTTVAVVGPGASYDIILTLDLSGSGYVRWAGTFRAWIGATDFALAAEVIANIHMDCAEGKVSPFGSYTVDSYAVDNPRDATNEHNGYANYIVHPTSIVLQAV